MDRRGRGTFTQHFRHSVERRPERLCISFVDGSGATYESFTTGQLHVQAQRAASVLQRALAPASRVVLLYPPGPDYVVGFLGCLYAGLVPVPSYPPDPQHLEQGLERLARLLQASQAGAIACTDDVAQFSRALMPSFPPELQNIKWLSTSSSCGAAELFADAPVGPDSAALIQFTSGSTAKPKGVVISHRVLLANLEVIVKKFGAEPDARIVSWLPPYHDMGLIGGILGSLYAEVETTLLSPLDFIRSPLLWLKIIADRGARFSGGPNFAYDYCVKRIPEEERRQLDLRSWTVAWNGAEPVRAETLTRFADAFAVSGFSRNAFFPCYGLAESCLMVASRPDSQPIVQLEVDPRALERGFAEETKGHGRVLVSSGSAVDGATLAIVDPSTRHRVADGHVGEIWVSGPIVASGYYNDPDSSMETFQARLEGSEQTYLRTGDLGFAIDGQLFVTGRVKDVIIVRGRNYYATDLEETVSHAHPAIRVGCVAAFSVEANSEEGICVLAEVDTSKLGHDAEGKLNFNDVILAVRRRFSEAHLVPLERVGLVAKSTLPKTSSGKLQRGQCRERYSNKAFELLAQHELAEPMPKSERML